MNLFAVNLIMAIVWVAVSGSATIHNLVFGFVLSALSLGLVREQIGGKSYLLRARRVLSLSALFLAELAKSAWRVAVLVLRPDMKIAPGIFAYPLALKSDAEIALLANLITLTPGTLSVDISKDRATLYVHALDCSDVEAAIEEIARGFETKVREAFE